MDVPRFVPVLSLVLTLSACAHERAAARPAAPAPPPVRAVERQAVTDADPDGDGKRGADDACPLEPGPAEGDGCPQSYGYFFLRVIDADTRAPVTATLVFNPSVTRVVGEDDGFAGTVAPGIYRVRAIAPGYQPAELGFDVGAQGKARLELTLRKTSR